MSTIRNIQVGNTNTDFVNGADVATFHEKYIDFFGSKFEHQDFEIMRGLLDWFHSLEGDHPVKTEIMTEIAMRRLQK